jgi:hypothetical protein
VADDAPSSYARHPRPHGSFPSVRLRGCSTSTTAPCAKTSRAIWLSLSCWWALRRLAQREQDEDEGAAWCICAVDL